MRPTPLPWTLLGLPEDFALRHLALTFATDDPFALDRGEVMRPELLDSRMQPVAGGLHCPAIFGETGDTDRFGHVELPRPVIHPLALVQAPAWLARRTGVSAEGLRQLVDYKRWLVIDAASDSGVEVGSLVDEEAAQDLLDDPIELATGAEAIERLLARRGHASASLTRIRVLPLGFRPHGRTDLDDLYRRLINRAARLRRLIELDAPEIILRNEIIMTQAAVDSVFCNEAREAPSPAPRDRPMQSLLGFVGSAAMAESLVELDDRGLGGSLSEPLLRTVRVLQALHLELRAG
jgi:DNA-directed RNA polymerase beta' subunit